MNSIFIRFGKAAERPRFRRQPSLFYWSGNRINFHLVSRQILALIVCLGMAVVVAGCMDPGVETAVTVVPPTPTSAVSPTTETPPVASDRDFVVVATDAPNLPFTDFDEFGNVVGFNERVMEYISVEADFDYEFVVTPHEGVLETLRVDPSQDFDAVMSTLIIPEVPPPGIAYTSPYLEVGQVLVVRANETELRSYRDIRPGIRIGVQDNSSGEEAARIVLGISDTDLYDYETADRAIQALIDGEVQGIIIDSYVAEYSTEELSQQLKIAGREGREAWINRKAYGIAVASDNTDLLNRLNEAINQIKEDNVIDRLTVELLPENFDENIEPGESLVGTPANEIIIGIVSELADMDPASDPNLISWEVKKNTMSGLFMFDSNNELIPILAAGQPTVSEDKLEYTFTLRRGLRFPDDSEFTADDVKWSISRSARLGSFLVNAYLKDSNADGFADEDAVQVVDQFTVKFVLQEPTAYFLSLLAIPPYYPVSNECYSEGADPLSTCGGIGPYTIMEWRPGDSMRLKTNPQWPGRPVPAFENITLRFYDESDNMRVSLQEYQSIDVAWTGLSYGVFDELNGTDINGDGSIDVEGWEGPATFKSYLIFEQSTSPWDSERVRQAVAYAVDREALAQDVFGGSREPLFSPVPSDVPGHISVLPVRDLGRARSLLLQEGYSQESPLEITIWYVNDGHYSPLEAEYANALKAQLEETGAFQVSLSGAPWDVFRTQISQCNYPAYLLGWPSPGQPPQYLDVTSWTDFFVETNASEACVNYPNYESEEMTELVAEAREELDREARLDDYTQIQQLWAEDLPTLDLLQAPRFALSLAKVDNVRMDAMGLLHYETLTKGGG